MICMRRPSREVVDTAQEWTVAGEAGGCSNFFGRVEKEDGGSMFREYGSYELHNRLTITCTKRASCIAMGAFEARNVETKLYLIPIHGLVTTKWK